MFETIAAFCRGDDHFEFPELYVDRSCLKARDPPQIKFEHTEYAKLSGAAANSFNSFDQPDAPSSPMPEEHEYRTLHLTAAMIDALKAQVPTKCSTFESVVRRPFVEGENVNAGHIRRRPFRALVRLVLGRHPVQVLAAAA